MEGAINTTGLLNFLELDVWKKLTVQAKSDVIRVFLLHKYGGVWADATLCMTEGLEPWLHLDGDFETFVRHDGSVVKSTISPWIRELPDMMSA